MLGRGAPLIDLRLTSTLGRGVDPLRGQQAGASIACVCACVRGVCVCVCVLALWLCVCPHY